MHPTIGALNRRCRLLIQQLGCHLVAEVRGVQQLLEVGLHLADFVAKEWRG